MTTVTGTQGPMGGQSPTVTGPAATSEIVTVADPAPLGLAAFGITTLLLSVINAGWVGAAATPIVLAVAIPYGGLGQILAGMWAFRRGNTFAATAFTSYGAFWISYFLLVEFAPGIKDATVISPIIGTYLLSWGIFTAYMFLASLAGSRAVQAVFLLLAATFVLLAIGAYATSDTWTHIGGDFGLATTVAALYASFADVLNANFKRTILPTN